MQIVLKPFKSIPPFSLAIFSFSLFSLQLLQGTSIAFAQNILIFNLTLGMAFNFVRGFSSVFGWLMVILAFRQVLISQVIKVLLWQAADVGLDEPLLISQVYALGMVSMCCACFVSQFFNLQRLTLVKNHLSYLPPRFTTVLFVVGLIVNILLTSLGEVPIILLPLFNALTYVGPIAYLALAYEFSESAQHSQGKKIFNKRSFVMLSYLFVFGVLSGSKQNMLSPFLVLFLVAIFNSCRLNFRYLTLVAAGVIAVGLVLTPISDDGRNYFKKENITETALALVDYVRDNFSSLENYSNYMNRIENEAIGSKQGKFYFGRPMLFLDRLSLIQDADKLVAYYAPISPEGWQFLRASLHVLPRSLTGRWLGSDEWQGDFLAKKIGIISENDDVTGVAFGMFAEAFAIQKWWGVITLTFITSLLLILGLALLDVSEGSRVWSVFVICYLQQTVGETGVIGSLHIAVRMIPFLLIWKKTLENLEAYFAQTGTRLEAYQ